MNARLELQRYQDARFVGYNAEAYAPLSFDRPAWIDHIPKHVKVIFTGSARIARLGPVF